MCFSRLPVLPWRRNRARGEVGSSRYSPALRIAASARSRCARPSASAGASRSVGLRRRGKKQTRLQKREPRRHDQIVGGKLEAQFARGFDEEQILLGQREDGNARQIDPLPSGKLQQQVKRTFETIEIDGERGLARRLSEVEIDTKRCPFPTNHLLGACWRTGRSQARGRRACSTGRVSFEQIKIYGFQAKRIRHTRITLRNQSIATYVT